MLTLPEGQKNEAREPSKIQRTFGNRSELDRKILSLSRYRVKCVFHSSLKLLSKTLKVLANKEPDTHGMRIFLQVKCSLIPSNGYQTKTA